MSGWLVEDLEDWEAPRKEPREAWLAGNARLARYEGYHGAHEKDEASKERQLEVWIWLGLLISKMVLRKTSKRHFRRWKLAHKFVNIVSLDQQKGEGEGLMVDTGVGMLTKWGQLMAAIGNDTTEETPLQVHMNGVATLIGKVGTIVVSLVLWVLLVFYFVGWTEARNESENFKSGQASKSETFNTVVQIFETAVTIVVVAVPEGLPPAVTLNLAYAMKKMIVDKALVRRLSACETMGCATTNCSDKTRTLTLNQTTVVKAWVGGEMREPVSELQMLHKDYIQVLFEGIVQNNNASVYAPPKDGEPEVSQGALPISAEERNHLLNVFEAMASASLRCVAFAFMEMDFELVPNSELVKEWKLPTGSLMLLAIMGIKDLARLEVPNAVRRCQLAGIKVRMVTGDNLIIAKAIAIECGILQEGDLTNEGATFKYYSPEMRAQELPKISVMACSSPTDKLLMVRALRDLGEVVVVTGDGTNDAPDLREADIGLAMGIQGTEVAKKSYDIGKGQGLGPKLKQIPIEARPAGDRAMKRSN
ncbi:hypothetical protein L7F22_017659 [Adiantum nelumboides]|nr:hypothetical protein [Adiantum nelumboides]